VDEGMPVEADRLTEMGLRQSRCFSHARLYRPQRVETTKVLKMKRNNLNHYACRRVDASAGICVGVATKY
jgi:hypothetical protein